MGGETGGEDFSNESTLEGVRSILGEILELGADATRGWNRATSLEQLGADSLALIEAVEAAEARWKIKLEGDERLAEIQNLGNIIDWVDELRRPQNGPDPNIA